jgi:hypothetical protein
MSAQFAKRRPGRKMVRNSQITPSMTVPRPLSYGGDIVLKRMTYPTTLTTTTGGLIAISATTSNSVQSIPATEWSSFAARYQQYRVKALTLTFYPLYNDATSTATYPLAVLIVSDSLGGITPSSIAQQLADERAIVRSAGTSPFNYTVDWNRNPNAKLWTSTTGNIPTADQYQVNYSSFGGLANTTAYYTVVIQWLVEFRGSE